MTADKKRRDPWTDPDPQPGDFDEYIREAKPEDFTLYDPRVGVIPTDQNEAWLQKWQEEREERERNDQAVERRSA